jgi:hypothetical protein
MDTLVEGIRKRQFKVNYEGAKEIKTDNGVRQYAVFLAYLDKKDTL